MNRARSVSAFAGGLLFLAGCASPSHTKDNKTATLRVFEELMNRRQPGLVEQLFTADFVNHAVPGAPTGREEPIGVLKFLTDAFPDFRFEVLDAIAEGDRVACHVKLVGTHEGPYRGIEATGRKVEVAQIHVFGFRDGKVSEHWSVRDDLGMMRQLGEVTAFASGRGEAKN